MNFKDAQDDLRPSKTAAQYRPVQVQYSPWDPDPTRNPVFCPIPDPTRPDIEKPYLLGTASDANANTNANANANVNANASANSDGWLFESKGNLFQARMKAILGGSMQGLYNEIVDHCKLNGKSANDMVWLEQVCPYSLQNGSKSQRIIKKLAEKSDERFLIRIAVEFFSRNDVRIEVLKMFKEMDLENLNLVQIIELINKLNKLGWSFLTKLLTKVFIKFDETEKNELLKFVTEPSTWKGLLKMCGNHTTTITCVNPTKDFCEGNSAFTKYFGLTVLFALCLPGLVKGLSNVIFYKVWLFHLLY